MPILDSRRGLTALALAALLAASPVLAQGRPLARTARPTRPARTASQPGLLDLLQNTLSRLIASATTPTPSGKGGDAGVRIDPEGAAASPAPDSGTGTP